ncbi:MAG: winged helix-turn-helix transcriptional regulator [Rhodoblastus sp.]|nr:winged helix-turn-helix transcriptional regulator [Rhodoblastus sp.]
MEGNAEFAMMVEKAREASDFLKALSHESRLLLLCALSEGECSVGELENILGERQSTVSQQLARLRLDRLVATRRDGKTIYYSLADENVRAILDALRKAFCGPGDGVKAEFAES